MHAIVYVSEYTKSDESINQDLNDITKIAKETNPTLGITGLIFYHKRKFLKQKFLNKIRYPLLKKNMLIILNN